MQLPSTLVAPDGHVADYSNRELSLVSLRDCVRSRSS